MNFDTGRNPNSFRRNRHPAGVFLIWALAFLVTGWVFQPIVGCAESKEIPGPTHVIIISIDGLIPDLYMPGSMPASVVALRQMREEGSYAREMLPVYPSVTYACHSSLCTGDNPARHGIPANQLFDPRGFPGLGYWFASALRAPALWDVAHKAGLTTAAVSWPVSADSKNIDLNMPEFWTTYAGTERELLRRFATPRVLDWLGRDGRPLDKVLLDNTAARDSYMAAAAVEMIRREQPRLLMVHFIEVDHEEHLNGRSWTALAEAMDRVDRHVREIIGATRAVNIFSNTAFIVVGDHGCMNVQYSLMPNVLLARTGLIEQAEGKITNWKAMVQNTGGSAAVYLKNPSDGNAYRDVITLLGNNTRDPSGKLLYSIIPPGELARLGGPRGPSFYLEAAPGYMFSSSMNGASLVKPASVRANHGFLPDKPGMATGLLAFGCGIRTGVVMNRISILDVAPTAAALLGLKMPDVDGRVLNEILK